MLDYANYGLVFTGLFPIIISSIKVEKYYTNYYTGAWNIYGSILVILGFILDKSVKLSLFLIGIGSIIILILIYVYSKKSDNPSLIRRIGKSSIHTALSLFFIIFFFTNQIYFAIIIAIFSLPIIFITMKFSLIGDQICDVNISFILILQNRSALASLKKKIDNFWSYLLLEIVLWIVMIIILISIFIHFSLQWYTLIVPTITLVLLGLLVRHFISPRIKNVKSIQKL